MDGWMDRWIDGWMDRWIDGWMDRWIDGWMDVLEIVEKTGLGWGNEKLNE